LQPPVCFRTLAVIFHCDLDGGFDEGAVLAFASDPAPLGVAAPLASEPLPFLPGVGP
jgi:hypothetical protein